MNKQNLIQEEALVSVKDYAKQNGLTPEATIEKIKVGELAGKVIMREWFVDLDLSKDIGSPSERLQHTKQINIDNSGMKHFNIYKNPQGDYRAIKEGWSWSAFFFTGIWALINRMWLLGITFTGMEVFIVVSTAGAGFVLNLFWSIVLGVQGNKMLANHLLRTGYESIATLNARTEEEAIALFLKSTPKDPVRKDQKNDDKDIPEKKGNNLSIANELTQLATLKEDGYLTEEEFNVQKKKLLNA